MRKLALLLFIVSVIICSAESFVGLMFTDQIGTSIAVALDGLNITHVEDKAVITNSSDTTELPLASLASMPAVKSGYTELASFTVPAEYGSTLLVTRPGGGPGGGGQGGAMLITAEGLSSGTSYTITCGSSTTTATAKQ